MTTYIKGITFVSGTSSSVSPPEDYEIVDTNLNQNAIFGGRYIYLCYATTTDAAEALTGITLVAWSTSSIPTPSGYTQLTQDLNEGAKGKYIYACYTTNSSLSPITDVTVVAGGTRHTYPEDDTWVRINQDTNDGAKGDYIYICYKREERATVSTDISAGDSATVS